VLNALTDARDSIGADVPQPVHAAVWSRHLQRRGGGRPEPEVQPVLALYEELAGDLLADLD
jgi:hypothetical protein